MNLVPTYLALALVAAPMARAEGISFDGLVPCADRPIGSEVCSADTALAGLSGLEPAWGYHFRPAGGDAFAIVYVLGQIQSGIEARIAGADCVELEELAYGLSEIWAMYVSVDDRATPALQADFATVEGFVGAGLDYIAGGGCV